MADKLYTFDKSIELFKRAAKTIPQGIYGHMNPALTVPGSFPYYTSRAKGCRYWDPDGNEFIDYMCGYGPMVTGYNNDRIDAAANKQRELADTTNHPGPVMIELAEKLVSLVKFSDWAVLAKNGSDVTTWALRVAREFTGRPKVLAVNGEYHGAHAWCDPGHGGIIPEDRSNVHRFDWNDLDGFHKLVELHKGKIAAVIMTPYHHPAFYDSVLPAPGFWQGIEKTCREEGIKIVLDDVRAGFRLNIGGSHITYGFTPDLICFCKAIANGYPVSACLGKEELKNAAASVFLTGSYWNSSVPMAASLENLKLMEEEDSVGVMMKMGERLMKGLERLSKSHGLQVITSGPYTIPFMRFSNENNFYRQQLFSAEVSKRGSFLHPHHNWFISSAHTEADVDKTLEHADAAFKIVKAQFGS